MFTFLFLSRKFGGTDSAMTNTWERQMCIIPVKEKDTCPGVASLS